MGIDGPDGGGRSLIILPWTKGIAYLASTQGQDGFWGEERFTATGFPRVFYLRYHGYAKFFPMWALARYRNLKAANTKSVLVGM